MSGAQGPGLRIVSLVPSVTETLAALGAADALVGVTELCTVGAPAAAERVGGTKAPDVDAVIALRPDAVVANTEENRAADLDALREAGVDVRETSPRAVADVPGLITDLAALASRPDAAAPLLEDLDAARAEAAALVPATRVVAVTLVWRRPWRGVGPDTYVDDLLWQCGFANALSGFADRYPELDPTFLLGADVALLPAGGSQGGTGPPPDGDPYAFGADDEPAVADLVGSDVARRFIDATLLTWHGVRTAAALRTLSRLAVDLAG